MFFDKYQFSGRFCGISALKLLHNDLISGQVALVWYVSQYVLGPICFCPSFGTAWIPCTARLCRFMPLAILANCNHTIQSYGSYTYFAGFLVNGLKIIPENFAEYRLLDQRNAIRILDKNPLENPLPKLPIFFDQFK